MIEDFLTIHREDFSADIIIELLKYEEYINLKKENNIELTDKEEFFDKFIISPSFMARLLLRRLEKKGDYKNENR